ncbi:hypothetical protein J2S49_000763 [Arcanobacterium wilhelmae]|uniref:Uncharacterized protein n=1 Tax=Arcanobacterium wilhelmae TaxID=1803177 RepID=A0ABT9NAG8_9ACTO|nr:hypothetical protein [Arcanobacterium wilhelmae]MDP9800687.1 hypothetical protein [Arcanobacterium wilhelmae]WFN90087.1 hypothetical protein P8A24_07815 [Arcanobacterium wilhelmae]
MPDYSNKAFLGHAFRPWPELEGARRPIFPAGQVLVHYGNDGSFSRFVGEFSSCTGAGFGTDLVSVAPKLSTEWRLKTHMALRSVPWPWRDRSAEWAQTSAEESGDEPPLDYGMFSQINGPRFEAWIDLGYGPDLYRGQSHGMLEPVDLLMSIDEAPEQETPEDDLAGSDTPKTAVEALDDVELGGASASASAERAPDLMFWATRYREPFANDYRVARYNFTKRRYLPEIGEVKQDLDPRIVRTAARSLPRPTEEGKFVRRVVRALEDALQVFGAGGEPERLAPGEVLIQGSEIGGGAVVHVARHGMMIRLLEARADWDGHRAGEIADGLEAAESAGTWNPGEDWDGQYISPDYRAPLKRRIFTLVVSRPEFPSGSRLSAEEEALAQSTANWEEPIPGYGPYLSYGMIAVEADAIWFDPQTYHLDPQLTPEEAAQTWLADLAPILWNDGRPLTDGHPRIRLD